MLVRSFKNELLSLQTEPRNSEIPLCIVENKRVSVCVHCNCNLKRKRLVMFQSSISFSYPTWRKKADTFLCTSHESRCYSFIFSQKTLTKFRFREKGWLLRVLNKGVLIRFNLPTKLLAMALCECECDC